MTASSSGIALEPLQNPLHAVLLMGLGLAFWTIGTAIRQIATRPDAMRNILRHNPWTVLFKGRPNSFEEEKANLPDFFFKIYGAFGLLFTVIGLAVGASSSVMLVYALIRSLF